MVMQSRITSFIGPNMDTVNQNTTIKVEQYYIDDNSKRILEKLELSIDSQEKFNDFEKVFQKTLKNSNLKEKDVEKDKIKKIVYSNIIGLGKIEILLKDPNIKGIYCEGLHIPLIVDHVQLGNVRTDLVFNDSSELKRLIKNMANIGKVALDDNNPSASGTFGNGYKFKVDLGTQLSNPRFYINK
jgi:archaeal flagellar protein FlaI